MRAQLELVTIVLLILIFALALLFTAPERLEKKVSDLKLSAYCEHFYTLKGEYTQFHLTLCSLKGKRVIKYEIEASDSEEGKVEGTLEIREGECYELTRTIDTRFLTPTKCYLTLYENKERIFRDGIECKGLLG